LCGTTPTPCASASAAIFFAPVMPQQHREFLRRVQALAGGDRDVDVRRDQRHRVEVVRDRRILVEVGVVGGDAARQDDRLGGAELAVDLDAEVHRVADRRAILAHRLDRVADLGRVGREVGPVARVVGERGQVADGGEALGLGIEAPPHQRLARAAEDVVVDAGLVARGAAEELVGRDAEVLARDVPEGDVERGERAHDRRAPEVGPAVEVLPVVLDPQRILAEQVALEGLHRLRGRFQEAPRARLAEPDDPRVGMDLHEQVAVHEKRLDGRDLHPTSSPHQRPTRRRGIAAAVCHLKGAGASGRADTAK